MGIGKRIVEIRESQGISLIKLSKISGVSKAYISQLENGKASNPSMEVIVRLSEALGVATSVIIEEQGGKQKPNSAKYSNISKSLEEFIESKSEQGEALGNDEIAMLASIKLRGKSPKSAKDWDYIYETIKMRIERE